MWPIPPLKHDIVCLSFFPDNFVCCWIKKNHNAPVPFQFEAYERHSLHNADYTTLILFNPTHIKKIIHKFLSRYNLHNAFVIISLKGTPVSEQFIAQPTTNPHATDFAIKPSSTVLWGYQCMYHDDKGQSIFYLYKIPRFVLLQYQLLAISMHLNLIAITTEYCATLNTYKSLCGSTFRQSQLALDMMHNNNNLLSVIQEESLKQFIKLPTEGSLSEEFSYYVTAYGLFINQGL